MTNCNCVEHYQRGFDDAIQREINKFERPEILLTYPQLEDAALRRKTKYQGRYALVVFHHPDLEPTVGVKSWQLGMFLLTDKLGTRVTKILFVPTLEARTYSYGLVED
jgi:hypothetical protein